MDELIHLFNQNQVRYLLMGGQAVRLEGMPRFSMDWDFFIPPRDRDNILKINRLLEGELDLPLLPLGEGEKISSKLTRSAGVSSNSIYRVPGCQNLRMPKPVLLSI